jgi:hypothetical protein
MHPGHSLPAAVKVDNEHVHAGGMQAYSDRKSRVSILRSLPRQVVGGSEPDGSIEATVVCLKYGRVVFGPEHVNLLRRSTKEMLSYPHRFICLTDHAGGLDRDVETFPIPNIGLGGSFRRGGLAKLSLFSCPQLPQGVPTLYFDLDVLIIGDLRPMVDLLVGGDFYVASGRAYRQLRWARHVLSHEINTSILGYTPQRCAHYLEALPADRETSHLVHPTDEHFVKQVASGHRCWPPSLTLNYKKDCLRRSFGIRIPLFDGAAPPASAIVFHGRPRPHELVAASGTVWRRRGKEIRAPIPWLDRHFERYGFGL